MLSKQLDQITEADLNDLITLRIAERKTLDYKRQLPDEREKFVADVSSFANTSGGDLIYGIDAPSGCGEPTSIPGLSLQAPEQEKLRLEQFLQSGLRPPLPRHDIQPIGLNSGLYVLIVRAWQSWIGPHRVGDYGPFYARNSAGKYQLDVGQLRQAFGFSHSISQRISAFRAERISKVYGAELPAPVREGPRLLIHIASPSAFAPFPELDIADSLSKAFADHGDNFGFSTFQPFSHTGGWDAFVNLEGRVVFPAAYGGRPAGRSYVQIYRSGIVEALWLLPFVPRHDQESHQELAFIQGDGWVPDLLRLLPEYLAGLSKLGVAPPFFLFFSFLSIQRFHLVGPGLSRTSRPFDRDQILLPEIYVETLPSDVRPLLRRPLDMLWNAAGDEVNPYVS
ncbi:MAG: ATP-binding protein [Candidatus Binataceae bacterium]